MATLRKSANPIKSSLKSVASNKGMKKADAKGTIKLAEKTLSNAKQKLRTHDASMGGTKQQHDALKKQVKTAEKNLKSLNKTAIKVNNKGLSKSLGSVASNKGMKKSDVKRTITNKQIMLQGAREDYNTLTKKWLKATPNQDRTKDKASINLKRIDADKKVRALTKEIKSLNKTAQKRK